MTRTASERVPRKCAASTHEISETGEVVLFDGRGERLLLLNDVGAAVWLLVNGTRTTREISQVIVETLHADQVRVERDVDCFLEILAGHGLIEAL